MYLMSQEKIEMSRLNSKSAKDEVKKYQKWHLNVPTFNRTVGHQIARKISQKWFTCQRNAKPRGSNEMNIKNFDIQCSWLVWQWQIRYPQIRQPHSSSISLRKWITSIKTLSFGDGFKQERNEHEPATRSRGDQIKTWPDEIKTHHQIHEFSTEKIIAPLRGRAKPDFRSE